MINYIYHCKEIERSYCTLNSVNLVVFHRPFFSDPRFTACKHENKQNKLDLKFINILFFFLFRRSFPFFYAGWENNSYKHDVAHIKIGNRCFLTV